MNSVLSKYVYTILQLIKQEHICSHRSLFAIGY